MTLTSAVYTGRVFHHRRRPTEHRLQYRVFSLLLDLDEIDAIARRMWLFSRNRFNLLAFHDADFGEGLSESLESFVRRKLAEAGIDQLPARILLSCYPRVLGHAFNPLSLFYCLNRRGRCFAILHEVHNTFGERHWYVLPVAVDSPDVDLADQGVGQGKDELPEPPKDSSEESHHGSANDRPRQENWIRQKAHKQLYVSPFAPMDMTYRFRLNEPQERQVIVIRAFDDEGLLITASYVARRQKLCVSRLLMCLGHYPLLGLKVVAGIHWQAFLLWCKRVPWFRHQPHRTVPVQVTGDQVSVEDHEKP